MMRFSLSAPFHSMPGHAFGLQQSSLFGSLHMQTPVDEAALERLDAELSARMRDPVPARGAGGTGETAAVAWVDRLLQWTLILQREHRIPVSMRFMRRSTGAQTASGQTFFVALPSVDRRASLATLETVLALANDASGTTDLISARLDALADTLKAFGAPGVNTHSILAAAHDLDLPVWEYVPTIWGVGTGARARLFSSTITDLTPAIGVKLARDKRGTALLLRRAGLPVPDHLQASSLDEALAHAGKLGYPVVVKPADLDQGKGITADIREPDELRTAWQQASAVSKLVLVERHVDGFTHRLTVMQGRVIKVVKRVAGGVTGNGTDDIRTLVERAIADPLRSRVASRTGRPPLELDDEARGLLERAGLADTHVPAAGTYIRLRRRDNVNAGGTNEIIPVDEVHPDNLSTAIGAARLLRLDLAGIDLIVPDIRQSWRATGGAICEVNGQPQMGTRDTPEIYRELILALRPAPGRVPVHLAILASDAPAGMAALEPVARATGADTIAVTEGVFRAGARIAGPFRDGLRAAMAALADPATEALAFGMDARSLASLGLPCSRVDTVRLVGRPADDTERRLLRGALERIRDNVVDTNKEERPR